MMILIVVSCISRYRNFPVQSLFKKPWREFRSSPLDPLPPDPTAPVPAAVEAIATGVRRRPEQVFDSIPKALQRGTLWLACYFSTRSSVKLSISNGLGLVQTNFSLTTFPKYRELCKRICHPLSRTIHLHLARILSRILVYYGDSMKLIERITYNAIIFALLLAISITLSALHGNAAAAELEKGVRGLATRAPASMTIDGDLAEFAAAFCTPINYFNPNLKNRPAQFFYMWDDEAFYAGLRTIDESPANNAADDRLWEGDGVEWYFDTRRGDNFRSKSWTNDGSVHCYWVGMTKTEIKSRFCLRPGYLDAIPKIGIEVASRRTKSGVEVEFKMPWKNFPKFQAKEGQVIAVDAELCYSDGGPRVDRFF
ncbi:MAG: hypothetical protein ACI9G1_004978, partial [Pirellulaceae bacterium]